MLLLALLMSCDAPPPAPPLPTAQGDWRAPIPSWPAEGAPLTTLPLPEAQGPWRVVVDAGHGASGNAGNTGVRCQKEQDETLREALALADHLRAGPFEIRLGREGEARPGYRDRVAAAEAWPADALVSLHTDSRGWTPDKGDCPQVLAQDGFAVLWSDEGPEALVAARVRLARALGRRLAEAGFRPYDGDVYPGLYDTDPEVPGVFLDRHQPTRRIYMLRGPRIPSVIIETHHALDPAEVARWDDPATLQAFSAAVAAGLVDALGE
ncbi:MAG: N-acetylmuramoyl-L-alanine amidase [Alphaproteobacteria bacterium]|nr:N-acetylmuramoyl-L-alanine amidase [Alphaproteobacteria bacterium]